jgi:hypothetical protein
MKLAGVGIQLSCTIVLALSALASDASAQVRDSSNVVAVNAGSISQAAMDTFAATHIAIAELRGKVQAELAEPRSKKPEVQASLREQLQSGTERLLKEHNLTDAEFTRLTRRVSTDDVARKQFEDALARLSKP